jgi:prophage regulatory protein
VSAETGIGRTHLYALMAQGKFPQSIPLAGRAVGWLTADILAWREQRIREARHRDWSEILKEREQARKLSKKDPEASRAMYAAADRHEAGLNWALLGGQK